ncbi:MAG: response regulator transcription factor [Patescibacteria group bacterium]
MRLLVIEDQKRIARYIKEGLTMARHTVDLAYDGVSGVDLAATEPYDVIILDRMLPDIDGSEVCLRLRNNHITTPILLLTARNTLDDRISGLNAGADDYLAKPFDFPELLARILALGRRSSHYTEASLSIGGLVLDTTTKKVTRNGTEISLSPKEYALLEYLIRHPDQVFSKEQLTERVWGFEDDVLPNTAQVYIGYLRSKLDQAFPGLPPLIITVRGFGYKLCSTLPA